MPHPARRLPPWLVLAGALLLPALALAQSPPRAAGEREAVIANDTGLGMRELYVRPANAADPGPDRLNNEAVLPGTSFRARLGRQANCSFDIRAVFMDNSVVERRAIDLCRNSRVAYGDPSAPLREATVTNFTDLSIQYLYAALPGAADRGPDRLGNEVIGAGDSFRMRLGRRQDCVFDVVAVFEDETEEQRDRQDLCRNQRISFGDPSVPLREVTISNEGQEAIQRLFASPPETEMPGPDRLLEGELAPGDSYRIRIRGRACVVDIRAEYDGHDAETQVAVDICATGRVAFDGSLRPRREERPITLLNRHGMTVREAYVSLTAAEDWGEDRLGEATLERGQRLAFTIAADCQVDIRVVFANGAAEERREVDICTTPVVVLTPGWTVATTLEADVAAPAPGGIRIRNQGGAPMVGLFLDAPGTPRGPERLGASVLEAGATLDLRPPEGLGCIADLFALFRDGQEAARPGLDLCAGQEVSLP